MTIANATSLGRYRVEGKLGHGGMAVVYRARDEELDRVVAIKLLADNLAGDPAFRQRFLREARLAARLQHPNIVQIYDTGERDGRPFIVMEYVAGESLAERLAREEKLAPPDAVALALQICAGLEHAHQAGLVHRDVKPQNLLLGADGTAKITDFGIARSSHGTRLTEIGSVLGTAAYLAPEAAAGQEVTAAADIYGLGVVLYQMLTGSTPYSYETLTQLLVDQHQQPAPSLRERAPEVPPALEDAVMRCLARLPEYRPPSANALAAELEATLPELPTRMIGSAPPATPTRPTRVAPIPARSERPYRSNFVQLGRKRVAITAIVLVFALALGVALLARGGSTGSGDSNAPAGGARTAKPKPALEQARDLSDWLRANTR